MRPSLSRLDSIERALTGEHWRADIGSFETTSHVITAATHDEHWSVNAIIVSKLYYQGDRHDLTGICELRNGARGLIDAVIAARDWYNAELASSVASCEGRAAAIAEVVRLRARFVQALNQLEP